MNEPGGYVDISRWEIFKTFIFLIIIAVIGCISFLWLEGKKWLRRKTG
jgi:hypothetical protein